MAVTLALALVPVLALLTGCGGSGSKSVKPPDLSCKWADPWFTCLDYSPTWAPSGDTLAFVRGRDSLGVYLVSTAGGRPRRILATTYWDFADELSWSPVGGVIALGYGDEICTLEIGSGQLRRWTALASVSPRWPRWSPDGRYILFDITGKIAFTPDSSWGLHIIDTRDGTSRAILNARGEPVIALSRPSWSSTGEIAYATSPGSTLSTDVWVIGVDGSRQRRLTRLVGIASNPQWTPDGRSILFDYSPSPRCYPTGQMGRSTWVVGGDGSGLREWVPNLGDPHVTKGYPFELKADGEEVAGVALDSTGTIGVIRIMRLDGSGKRQITGP